MSSKKGGKGYSWAGNKTERIIIRCTPQEKIELKREAEQRGGVGVSRYLINLHHRNSGKLAS